MAAEAKGEEAPNRVGEEASSGESHEGGGGSEKGRARGRGAVDRG